MDQGPMWEAALLVSIAVAEVVNYLVAPLTGTPKIAAWLVKMGLAYVRDASGARLLGLAAMQASTGEIVFWPTPYMTFVLSFCASLAFGINLVGSVLPNAGYWPAVVLTAAIVGAGSDVIRRVASRQ